MSCDEGFAPSDATAGCAGTAGFAGTACGFLRGAAVAMAAAESAMENMSVRMDGG